MLKKLSLKKEVLIVQDEFGKSISIEKTELYFVKV